MVLFYVQVNLAGTIIFKNLSMSLKEYLEGKTIICLEVVDDIILSIKIEESFIALDVDTTNIKQGTKVNLIYDFTIKNNIIFFNKLKFDTSNINILN